MDLYLGFHVLALHSRLLRWLVLGHGGNLVFVVLQNVVNKLKKMALGYMPTILFVPIEQSSSAIELHLCDGDDVPRCPSIGIGDRGLGSRLVAAKVVDVLRN